ncbi:MAG: hemolysin III family protein [Lachnospira sp.]
MDRPINHTVEMDLVPFKITEFHIKDFWSSMTHFIGLIMSFSGSLFLINRAMLFHSWIYVFSMIIFSAGLMLLYGASTAYHTFDISPVVNRRLKKLDHMMISVLIAASYTPVCLLSLPKKMGIILLSVIWGLAITGIVIKALWVYCPKWISSILYIGMGWACLFVLPMLYKTLSLSGFMWLLVGGILYTIGGVIYAVKFPSFNRKHVNFGTHEIFHLFVMAGSLCHFVFMYSEILAM